MKTPITSITQYDSRLGEIQKGSELWDIITLNEYLSAETYKLEATANKLVLSGKTNEQIWEQLAKDLENGDFPELATVLELYDTGGGNMTAQIKCRGVTHTPRFRDIHKQFRAPDWKAEASRRVSVAMLTKMRYIAKKSEADEKKSIAEELLKAQAIIRIDAALNPMVREARMRMASYSSQLKAAAEIIAKHG